MKTAEIIRDQIGSRALYLLGAKDLVSTGNGLRFRIGRNARHVTHLEVTLDISSDTYTVTCWKCRGLKSTRLSEIDGIYCDRLHAVIEAGTGLVTSLGEETVNAP